MGIISDTINEIRKSQNVIQTKTKTIDLNSSNTIPWMRVLKVVFKNKKGQTLTIDTDSLAIQVKVSKRLLVAADKALITIYNYPLKDVDNFRSGGFTNDVSIYCGYKNTNVYQIFNGGVIYYEEYRNDVNTSVLKFNCGCKLLSDRFQEMYAETFSSGTNLYNIVQRVSEHYGISNQVYIDDCLSSDEITNELSGNMSMLGWLSRVVSSSSNNRQYVINNDTRNGKISSVLGYKDLNKNIIYKLNTLDVNIESYPTISSDGLRLVLAPIYDITPGDVIGLDFLAQSLIDVSQNADYSTYYGNRMYVDKDGLYTIKQIDYNLNNRGREFTMITTCISKNTFIDRLLGKDTGE